MRASLNDLLDRLWRWLLDSSPEFATYVGESRSRPWTDYAPAACADRRATRRAFLRDLHAIPRDRLDSDDAVSYAVAELYLTAEVGVDDFDHEALLVDQVNGVHLGICQSLDYMAVTTAEDKRDYVDRLRAIPGHLDQVVALLRSPAALAARPAQVVLADVPRQLQELRAPESPLLRRLRDEPGTPVEVVQEAESVVREVVEPALGRFESFVVDEMLPTARHEVGLSAVGGGEAWYDALILHQTSLSMAPRAIHELGLAEVARIRDEMEALAAEGGLGSVAAFRRQLHDDEASYFGTAEQQLQAYRALAKEVDASLWRVVTNVPRMPYGVEEMPSYMAASAPSAYYIPGSGQARRPGTFMVNSYDLRSRPAWAMVPLTLHEAVPGHHLQHAVADELTDLPPLRRHLAWNSYVEGWGLYAEYLGEDLGFYRTPGDRYGRLAFDMWRAARLVVDTGLHAFGWGRDEAIRYLGEATGLSHHDVTAEVDRYIAWPAQALGYKLGERTIQDLRREAATRRDGRFRVEEFHDVLLRQGPLPLPVLRDEVGRWAAAPAGPDIARRG